MSKTFRLCYVLDEWAYFTTAPIRKQWGDDWGDAPYQCNAGPPYNYYKAGKRNLPCKIMKVGFDGDFYEACDQDSSDDQGSSKWYSVEQINSRKIPWLVAPNRKVTIYPGATLDEFRKLIAKAGGRIYEARK